MIYILIVNDSVESVSSTLSNKREIGARMNDSTNNIIEVMTKSIF